jgi:tetratricopeptide (TPR) repeat protein
MNTTDYAAADSFFYEADLRKKGYHFEGNLWGPTRWVLPTFPGDYIQCPVDTSILDKRDVFAFFTWGVQEYESGKYANAVRVLNKVIALDKTNPLVFHYLGKIYFDQQKWEEAEVMFKYAMQFSLNTEKFDQYVDSVIHSATYLYDHECFEKFFKKKFYEQIEDYFFAGRLYELWNHPDEAESVFNKIIDLQPDDIGGYLKLWQLLENLGRYTEAEQVINYYGEINPERSERELNEFYRRTIEKFPENADWNYRLGLLLYSRAEAQSKAPYIDTIVWFPRINKEIFIDLDVYHTIGTTEEMTLYDKMSTGAPKEVTLGFRKERSAYFRVPGTMESLRLADAIYLPRKDGIEYLSRAEELIPETESRADINFKIGNIYVWAGSKKQAYPYYVRSLDLIPSNANARFNLVDVSKAIYKNREALKQLNFLYDSGQINFPKRLLLSEFDIHAGRYETADKLLTEAESFYPYVLPEIADLRGRLNMLAAKPKIAISFYESFLNTGIFDTYVANSGFGTSVADNGDTVISTSIQLIDSRRIPAYSIARLYAKTGNTKQALKWLQTAIDYGFNLSFVLKYDPYMENLRKTSGWKKLTRNIMFKTYNTQNNQQPDNEDFF